MIGPRGLLSSFQFRSGAIAFAGSPYPKQAAKTCANARAR